MPCWRYREADAACTPRSAVARTSAITAADLRNRCFLQRRVELAQSLVETHLGFPPEYLLGACDVGLPDLGVVDGERLIDDLAAAAPDLEHLLGQLEQGELLRVADVDGQVLTALGQRHQAPDQVVDVTEAPSLGAVPEDGDRL